MGSKGRRLALLLAVAAMCAGIGAWLLTRETGVEGAARDAAVLTRDRATSETTAPTLPAEAAAAAAGMTPESLAADAPGRTPEELAAASADAAAAALRGVEALFTGRVVDESGAPIADAIVTHVPAYKLRKELGLVTDVMSGTLAWERLLQARTATDGSFAIAARDLPAEAMRVTNRDSGNVYTPASQPELVVRHAGFALLVHPCTTFRGGPFDVGTLVLSPCSSLAGRVVDVSGAPVPGATLRVERIRVTEDGSGSGGDERLAQQALSVVAGSDGRFLLTGFPSGGMGADVMHPDYIPERLSRDLRPGVTEDVGDIVLARGGTIRGIVLDDGGRPVAHAAILARASGLAVAVSEDSILMELRMSIRSSGAHEIRTRSDESGAFTLGSLNQPSYAVFVDGAGREPAVQRDVPAGSDDLVFRLLPQGTLLLTVVDATSEAPVPGVRGTAVRRSGNDVVAQQGFDAKLDVLSGSAAVAAISAAAPGQAADGAGLLLVERAGTMRTEVTVSAPGYETRGFVLPGVQPGEQLARTVKLKREALLAGHVLADDAGRAPIADALVLLLPPEDSRVQLSEHTARTDAEGAFRFGELHAGEWTLSVSAPGFLESNPRPLDVKPEQVRDDLEVLLPHGAQLDVLLLDTDGAPAPGQPIVVTRPDAPPAQRPWKQVTGTDGRARFDALPAGTLTVNASPGAEATVALVAGEATEITLALRRPPRVRGRVTAGGQPVAGARVVASTLTDNGYFSSDSEVRTQASASGDYALQLPGAGRVMLVAHDQDDEDASSSLPVQLVVDWDQMQHADLIFGGARVAGLVVDAQTQQPLAGASLRVLPRMPIWDLDFSRYTTLLQAEAHTGDDGRFLFPHVQPGSAQLTVSAKGYVKVMLESVVAVEGDTVELPRVELSRGIVIQGVVRTASGKGLPPDLRVSLRASPDAPVFTETNVAEHGGWKISSGSLQPGAWTLCVDRQVSAIFGDGTKNPPILTEHVVLMAGETKVVDLVLNE